MPYALIAGFMILSVVSGSLSLNAQVSRAEAGVETPAGNESLRRDAGASYLLGPEDSITIKMRNAEEIAAAPYAIDLNGNIDLPYIGSVHAAGLTVNQLQVNLAHRFQEYIKSPDITISISEFRSQPISVLGAVTNPGVHQLRGRKTLLEAISEAGGIKPEAGNTIKITRRKEFGDVPLPGAGTDASKEFSVGEISIRSIMQAQNPAQNITVKPYDVITVPKADLVYVVGDVKRPGGFPLSERPDISLLEALSMAQGLERTAAGKKARILRASGDSPTRAEIPVDVNRILSGRGGDVTLLPNDILFIPNSAAKSASSRAIEAMIQIGTGVMIYSHF